MFIVLDTNVWIKELGLRSNAGAAVRFFVRYSNARVALPEVVRLEVEHNLRNGLRDYIEHIQGDYRKLLTIFGRLREVVLPTEAEIEAVVAGLFTSLGIDLLEIPFSLSSATSSFLKTINKTAPSDKSQEFKDGVLWADCLALLEQDDVILVSEDKAFYQNRNYKDGLAAPLALEVAATCHKLSLHSNLSELLDGIRTDVVLDDAQLVASFFGQYASGVNRILGSNAFALDELLNVDKHLFVTDDPSCLFLEFRIMYKCVDMREMARTDGILVLNGDGRYKLDVCQFEQLRNFSEQLTFKLIDGTEQQVRSAYIYADNIVLGHKEVSTNTRYKLD